MKMQKRHSLFLAMKVFTVLPLGLSIGIPSLSLLDGGDLNAGLVLPDAEVFFELRDRLVQFLFALSSDNEDSIVPPVTIACRVIRGRLVLGIQMIWMVCTFINQVLVHAPVVQQIPESKFCILSNQLQRIRSQQGVLLIFIGTSVLTCKTPLPVKATLMALNVWRSSG